ncbi:hypothetical protein N0V90_004697 [Kalmusia sp. IMI 367209]|nr:hypothetical protein N0V90_004697 [Kalmusia sp. IMI 367209]
MATLSRLVLLSTLLSAVISKALYPQSIQRPPGILHDFQKNNVSTSWAPGHPKEWSEKEALKFQFSDGGPHTYTSGAIPATALSSDEKFLVTVNISNHVSVIDFATGSVVSNPSFTTTYSRESSAVRVLSAPSGGYDVLISMGYQEVQRLRLSAQGKQTGNATIYTGGLLSEFGSSSVSHSGRRFLTVDPNIPQYNIYDLDDTNVHIILKNQNDVYHDGSFSTDDKYVITLSRSYYDTPPRTKLFDATTGALVRDFGSTSSEYVRLSPDGKLLATTYSWDAVQLWPLTNATSEPITLNLPAHAGRGFSDLQWSPDGEYLAAGIWGQLVVWKIFPSPQVVQSYQQDNDYHDVTALLWLEASKRIAYRTFGGLEIYDFDSNLKYRWGFGANSHWADSVYQKGYTFLSTSKKWIGGLDADAIVRFWEYPA